MNAVSMNGSSFAPAEAGMSPVGIPVVAPNSVQLSIAVPGQTTIMETGAFLANCGDTFAPMTIGVPPPNSGMVSGTNNMRFDAPMGSSVTIWEQKQALIDINSVWHNMKNAPGTTNCLSVLQIMS